jgi:hypothetical protein
MLAHPIDLFATRDLHFERAEMPLDLHFEMRDRAILNLDEFEQLTQQKTMMFSHLCR